ncbi:Glyoxalase/Bleomycin resistance protein/Dihydroxybiphenyl dioxygenase [Phytophthora cactorum]|nr:Glyoxalase/Bleomycin resistance protein/Dihydroxybiphenyl dioxygenase [Phytophthora cactorum]
MWISVSMRHENCVLHTNSGDHIAWVWDTSKGQRCQRPLQQAEDELAGVWRYSAGRARARWRVALCVTNLSIRGMTPQPAAFGVLHRGGAGTREKVSEGIAAYIVARSQRCKTGSRSCQDAKEAQEATQKLESTRRSCRATWPAAGRPFVAYRQRAKIERLELQRRQLIAPESTSDKGLRQRQQRLRFGCGRDGGAQAHEAGHVTGDRAWRWEQARLGFVAANANAKVPTWEWRQNLRIRLVTLIMCIRRSLCVSKYGVYFNQIPLVSPACCRGLCHEFALQSSRTPFQIVIKMAPGADSNDMKLVGCKNFQRHNPKTDRFDVHKFHHIEFYCADATNVSRRFAWGLGMGQIGKSDQSTGNHVSASYVIQSGEVKLVFTAPYALETDKAPDAVSPIPGYDPEFAQKFVMKHGLAVRALGILVGDAKAAYEISVQNGGVGVQEPHTLTDKKSGKTTIVSEVKLYGDVVIRWVSGDFEGPFLVEAVKYITGFTGFHEFAEFTAEDVGTLDSGLNSMVLASNNEMVLLPVNEPTFGTKRKSQIQTYLEQNVGAGLQHMALKTDDIFHTLAEMQKRSHVGGFEFMPRPNKVYYEQMPERIGDSLTKEQYKQSSSWACWSTRTTKVSCCRSSPSLWATARRSFSRYRACGLHEGHCWSPGAGRGLRRFGKGNFSALFKSIEDYEKSLNV